MRNCLLTLRQKDVLDVVSGYIDEFSISPTLDEIGTALGIRRVSVLDHLRALERKGAIRRKKFVSRSIEVLGQASKNCLECKHMFADARCKGPYENGAVDVYHISWMCDAGHIDDMANGEGALADLGRAIKTAEKCPDFEPEVTE